MISQNSSLKVELAAPQVTLSSLEANPTAVSSVAGTYTDLPVVTAVYSNQSTAVIASDDINWTFGTQGVATIDGSYLVGPLNAGVATIYIAFGGQTQTVQIVVPSASNSHSDSTSSTPTHQLRLQHLMSLKRMSRKKNLFFLDLP